MGTLSGASAGATTLGEANQITNLGTFSAASLLIHNASPLTLLGNVTTTGAQTYDAALLLGADRVLSGTDITFNSTVDGAHALTVNASGITTFGAAVGGTTALASLTTDAPGSTTLSGNVTTSGTQTWGDTVTLGSNATLTGTTGRPGGGRARVARQPDGDRQRGVRSGGGRECAPRSAAPTQVSIPPA
ncbi:hypothetical protein [Rhodanobacter lindaniclasticus]